MSSGSGEAGRPAVLAHSRAPERMAADKVRCEACPVLCQISPGQLGACDRYGNVDGVLTRHDPLQLVARRAAASSSPGRRPQQRRLGRLARRRRRAGLRLRRRLRARPTPTTSRRPSSSSSQHQGVDMVTVVTEGIFSYCSFKVKIDTDRYLGPEQATVRHRGRGGRPRHAPSSTARRCSPLGGVHHLTGGSKKEGRVTCEMMLALGNRERGRAADRGRRRGSSSQAGRPPVIDGVEEQRMRVGCGSATIGIFAQQWLRPRRRGRRRRRPHHRRAHRAPGRPLPRHAADRHPHARPQARRRAATSRSPIRARGWGGTDIADPLSIIERLRADARRAARPARC